MLVAASTACVLLVIGSIAFEGLRLPTRSVPPCFAGAAGAPNARSDSPTNRSSAPIVPAPRPNIAARRMNS